MRIYTRSGDDGQTGLYGGQRVPKDDLRIEAYGTVDELNATLGLARSSSLPAELDSLLETIQNELFSVGAELATPAPDTKGTRFVGDVAVERLERHIDRLDARLSPLTQFILPTGTTGAAAIHLARCVCRRAERRVVSLQKQDREVSVAVVTYLNRLGDLFFVMARVANAVASVPDTPWQHGE